MPDRNTFHIPVMMTEVLNGLNVRSGGTYIDATIGGGGYSIEIVKRGGNVLGIDQDPDAVERSTANIKFQIPNIKWGVDIKIVKGNFREIQRIAKENGFDHADGILFDLGVSSYQIDTADRGFSFRFEKAYLDMRMDPQQGIAASEYLRKLSQEELYEIFATYGEEKLARTIAHAIVRTRGVRPINTSADLIHVVDGVVRDAHAKMGTLARIFQALRILVNDELGALKAGISGAIALLNPGGRLAVLSYHSLEDRIVKREIIRLGLQTVHKRPMTPSESERYLNSRSRSAKLRIAYKL